MTRLRVETGLDRLVAADFASLATRRAGRVGLLCHPASVDARLNHARDLLHAGDVDLRCLIGPQHGLRGETQDNMIEWEGYRDPVTGLPVHSLYGAVREPTAAVLAEIDTLVVDLQDVGARYYTFIWTLLYCLRACARHGKRVVVLDRPNPLGGARQGNVLDPRFTSFVGLAPIPMRHGLTMGELALLFRAHESLDVEVEVVALAGWRREMWFDETGLPWVMPSPNMPTLATATVYPGACLLEGTELSEGRGTTRPFEIFGAPFIEPEPLVARLAEHGTPGCRFRPLTFLPTFQKHAGHQCGGAQIHVTDRQVFDSVLTTVTVLAVVRELWPDHFHWRQPPYEYEEEKLPFDVLAGGDDLRCALQAGRSPARIVAGWTEDLASFAAAAQKSVLYE